jgi:hypothetical protein
MLAIQLLTEGRICFQGRLRKKEVGEVGWILVFTHCGAGVVRPVSAFVPTICFSCHRCVHTATECSKTGSCANLRITIYDEGVIASSIGLPPPTVPISEHRLSPRSSQWYTNSLPIPHRRPSDGRSCGMLYTARLHCSGHALRASLASKP